MNYCLNVVFYTIEPRTPKPKAIESEGTVDSITTNEINEFLTTFFKLYPTATASELSYYVNDGILKPMALLQS
ncbi:hypothetical protein Y979_24955 (plasmid) [Escherichia coli str. Sanji]|nr:hypothetical protein Y979_24955 [Escherichia coli str. Sanji]